MRRLAPLALALLCAACAADPDVAPDVGTDPLVLAVTRLGRAEYAARLAPDGPEQDELAGARSEVERAFVEAGLTLGGGGPGGGRHLREVVAEARLVLAERGLVVLPPPLTAGAGDPGVALAPVVGRRLGLARTLAGREVRYRRVDHAGLLLPDFAAWAALRAGEGAAAPAWTPLGRASGPTVYVDVTAVARQAGRPPFAGVDAPTLELAVEAWQAGYLRFALEAADRALDGEPALVRLHARALLAALALSPAEGEPDLRPALLLLTRGLAAAPGAPAELAQAARFVAGALDGAPGDEAVAAARLLLDTR